MDFKRFAPGGFQQASNLIEGIRVRQWTYDLPERGIGQIAWQKTDSYANNLWLAFDEHQEAELLPGAVTGVFQRISQEHPISIDYPKGRAVQTLEALGFNPFRTLIWMVCH